MSNNNTIVEYPPFSFPIITYRNQVKVMEELYKHNKRKADRELQQDLGQHDDDIDLGQLDDDIDPGQLDTDSGEQPQNRPRTILSNDDELPVPIHIPPPDYNTYFTCRCLVATHSMGSDLVIIDEFNHAEYGNITNAIGIKRERIPYDTYTRTAVLTDCSRFGIMNIGNCIYKNSEKAHNDLVASRQVGRDFVSNTQTNYDNKFKLGVNKLILQNTSEPIASYSPDDLLSAGSTNDEFEGNLICMIDDVLRPISSMYSPAIFANSSIRSNCIDIFILAYKLITRTHSNVTEDTVILTSKYVNLLIDETCMIYTYTFILNFKFKNKEFILNNKTYNKHFLNILEQKSIDKLLGAMRELLSSLRKSVKFVGKPVKFVGKPVIFDPITNWIIIPTITPDSRTLPIFYSNQINQFITRGLLVSFIGRPCLLYLWGCDELQPKYKLSPSGQAIYNQNHKIDRVVSEFQPYIRNENSPLLTKIDESYVTPVNVRVYGGSKNNRNKKNQKSKRKYKNNKSKRKYKNNNKTKSR